MSFKIANHPTLVPRAADNTFDVRFMNSSMSPLGLNQIREWLVTAVSDEGLPSDAFLANHDNGNKVR